MDIDDLEIIVGTYEEFLLGYKVVQAENEEYILIQSFATHSHRASVRSLATGGKFLASGGSDESIILYDMIARKEAGLLMQHNGTVSCLEFAPNGSHLLSGSEDGSIGACRTGNWQLEKLWGKAHKGSAVTSISIHPSGKLFLSVGIDATVRTWNFVKGRPAYTTNLCKLKEGRSVTQVLWSPSGETYSVVIGTRVEIFSVAGASIIYTIQLDKKITCICYMDPDILCSAAEEGEVFLHDIKEKVQIGHFQAHDGRVRCLSSFKSDWIVTASSGGQIKLWWKKDPTNILEVCEATTGCRITCMALVNIKANSETVDLHSIKLIDLSPAKVDLDAEFATRAKKRKRPLGIVTVEVDEELTGNEKKTGKIHKKKRSHSGVTHTPNSDEHLIRDTNRIPKKKKKRNSTEVPIISNEEAVNPPKDHTRNKSKRKKEKKNLCRIEAEEEEMPTETVQNTRIKKKNILGSPVSERKSKIVSGTNQERRSKKQLESDRTLETTAKKSKKKNKYGTLALDVLNSPSGQWNVE